jgi:hypothetical protein
VSLAPIEIREASIHAIANGIRRYLPAAVGILVIGVPVCMLAAFAHFVLGASTLGAAGVGTFTTVAGYLIRELRQP